MTVLPEVFYLPVPDGAGPEVLASAAARLFDACGGPARFAARDLVAVKGHVGEEKNTTFLPPAVYRALGEKLRALGAQPFLTETSTLYRGQRENAVKHLLHAHRHGFSIEATGMPFIMADGLTGNSEAEVVIPGELNTGVKIAREVLVADGLVAVSHLTGHLGSGFGGVLKTLGMGLASRMGKLRQHSAMHPEVKPDACTFCQKCIQWCPEDAVSERAGKAFIDRKKCIGCGECVAVCRFDAVRYDWGMESAVMERHIAEHALGVVQGKRDKSLFLNFAVNLTKDCDCMDYAQKKLVPDLGVLASLDPVAADQAGLDIVRERHGRDLAELAWPELDGNVQLEHGEKIGLGSRKYTLRELG
jgi:uncharacterized protein